MTNWTTIGGAGGAAAFCAAAASYAVARLQRPKIEADTRRVDVETEGLALVNAEKVEALVSKRIAPLEHRHLNCERRLAVLEAALRANGIPIPY